MPLAVLGVLAFLLLFSGGRPVHAATITANSAADVIADDGVCTLREAITAANTDTASGATPGECPAGSGADTITLPAGTYTLSIPGTDEDANATGDLDITADLTINGAGAGATIIDGAHLDRVLHLVAGVTAKISGLTMRNGLLVFDGIVNDVGGGMYNQQGSATLTNVTFSDNYAWWGGGMFDGDGSSATLTNVTFSGNSSQVGGGMHNWGGSATLTNVTFSGNTATYRGGGMYNWGGSVTLTNVTFSGNTATYGGGMHNWSGSATLTNVTFSGNASQDGGGMEDSSSGATLTDVTFSGNSASHDGGGMYIDWSGSATLTNVTFSGNSAIRVGGGIANGGDPTLTNVTFSGNTATYGGGMASWGSPTLTNVTFSGNSASWHGGGTYASAGTLKNTIVANNSPDDCAGSITSAGHNLIEAAACRIAGDTTGNIIGVDPLLGALADNGGLTQTHALLAGSPAVDAGSPDCPPPTTDQRGVARPQGAACDIGAFELEPADSTPPAVTLTTPAEGAIYTLNQAVLADYTCEDEAGGSGLASCVGDVADGAAIDTASVGPNTFTVTAEDNAGNIAFLTHAYGVVYSFSGFFSPVDNPPTLNLAKAGSAIPVRFSLSGNQGLSIFATGYPRSQKISCDTSAPLDAIEETVSAGSSSLSYDPVADQYVYVWKTDKAWANACRQLVAKLNDGTEHVASFKFK
jgi:CSLREA domain-containing protein